MFDKRRRQRHQRSGRRQDHERRAPGHQAAGPCPQLVLCSTILSYKVMSCRLTGIDHSADKTADHMSRLFAAATALFVAAGSWSITAQPPAAAAGTRPVAKGVVRRVAGARSD